MAPRKRPEQRPTARRQEDALLHRLEEALSEDELRRVLSTAVLALDDAARERLLARLGPDTGAALERALSMPRKRARSAEPAALVAGKGKLRQEWDRAWKQWAEIVEHTGEERGKYVTQEVEWEPPYIDTTSISKDLDAVAARMRPLIPRVIAEHVAPDFSFAQAVESLDDDLYAGLPDWMESGGDEPCSLGPEATACLLEWEWRNAQRDDRGAPELLDDLRDLENGLENVDLDDATIKRFVLALPDQDRRAALESMTRQRRSARWADAFTHAHGCWAEILRELSRRWDPALFARTSRANISESWALALPLVQTAVKRKAYDEASEVIDEAIRSRLRLEAQERWDPRAQLFVSHQRYHHGAGREADLAKLSRLWQETAQARGQADVAAALGLQIVALREVDAGDRMLEAFRAFRPENHVVREALFADWRRLLAERTLETWGSRPRVPCGDWVAALTDAARAGPRGAPAFHAAVRAALDEARAAPEARPRSTGARGWSMLDEGTRPLHALAILTRDLDATRPTLQKTAPKLFKLLSAEVDRKSDRLEKTRRTWCARLGGPSLLPEVIAFWRDTAARFVPDPDDATAAYEESADWLAAVQEINPTAAAELLARWAVTHRLKRNLWREVAQRGFPVPAGVKKAPDAAPAGRSASRRRELR